MYSQAHSHAYLTSTWAHTDPYTVVEADANSKIEKEKRIIQHSHCMRPLATGFSHQSQVLRWHERGEICYFALPFWKVKHSLSVFLFSISPRRNSSKCSTTDSVNTSIWWKITAKNIPTFPDLQVCFFSDLKKKILQTTHFLSFDF